MNKTKLMALSGVALLVMAPAFADDFGFSSFGSDAVTATDTSSDDSSASFGSFDSSVFGGGDSSSDDSSSLQITGTAGLTSRAYLLDNDNDGGSYDAGETYYTPSLKLNLSYSDTNSDLTGSILLNDDTVNTYNQDIINEITYRAYVGNFVLEAGKTKIVWGRGDKVHVLDLINANDFTNFVIPDYIDRRIAEPEMDVTWNIPSEQNLSLQVVFTPGMTADRFESTGRWTPDSVSKMTSYISDKITDAATAAGADAYSSTYESYNIDTTSTQTEKDIAEATAKTAASTAALSTSIKLAQAYSDSDYYTADTNTLEYAQYAARLTGTKGMVDWGAEYYFGHYKTPSVSYGSDPYISLDYDRLQVFGIDAETVKGAYTMRGELAYYLTDDIDGDDASVHNNSIQWVAGIDRNLPWSNLSLNIQENGYYVLHYSDVQDNVSTNGFDMDENNADSASNNKFIVKLSDSLWRENLKPSVSVIYGIEGVDLIIMPEVSYIVKDGFEVTANASFVFSDTDTGEYQNFNNNAEVQLKAEYSF